MRLLGVPRLPLQLLVPDLPLLGTALPAVFEFLGALQILSLLLSLLSLLPSSAPVLLLHLSPVPLPLLGNPPWSKMFSLFFLL